MKLVRTNKDDPQRCDMGCREPVQGYYKRATFYIPGVRPHRFCGTCAKNWTRYYPRALSEVWD